MTSHIHTQYARWTTLAVLAFTVSCGGDSTPSADTVDDVSLTPDSATLASSTVDTSQESAATTLVALSGDGLMLVSRPSGSSRALEFNTPAPEVITALTAALGAPGKRSTNQDCGMGPLDFLPFGDELLIAIQNDQFLGWTVRRSDTTTMRTMSNIGLGSTRAELQGAYAAEIARSTLGMEFMAGGLQGILASDAPTAPITDLWAGASCVAR